MNSFPRDWCLPATLRLNGPFYIFQLAKAATLFPLLPPPTAMTSNKKKSIRKGENGLRETSAKYATRRTGYCVT